jgi:hypothetical protein
MYVINKIKMTSIIAYKRLNQWDHQSIRPGPVGSVGDTLGQIRFKHSFPDQGIRLDPQYKNNKQNRLGSNVSDGNHRSFTSGGRGDPTVWDEPWNANRAQKVSHGLIFQDVRASDKLHEPYLGALPQLSWQNKIATVYNAKRTGNLFLPLPGPYRLSPGEVPRGGQIPISTTTQGTTNVSGSGQETFDLQTNNVGAYNALNEHSRLDAYYQGVQQTANTGRADITRNRMF